MNSITAIILVGLVLITNITLVLLITKGDSSKNPPPTNKDGTGDKSKVEHEVRTTETTVKVTSHAGKGKLDPNDLDEYFEQMAQKAMKKVYGIALEQFIGDVKMNQVEFGDQNNNDSTDTPADSSLSSETASDTSSARMTKEQEAKAFNDVRYSDIEDEPVSAPSASGASIDEIEESVEATMNPAATPEAKSRAGRILAKFENTNLMDIFKNDESIYKNVMLCVKESIRMETTEEAERPQIRRRRNFSVPDNYDDFDPWDLIRKK